MSAAAISLRPGLSTQATRLCPCRGARPGHPRLFQWPDTLAPQRWSGKSRNFQRTRYCSATSSKASDYNGICGGGGGNSSCHGSPEQNEFATFCADVYAKRGSDSFRASLLALKRSYRLDEMVMMAIIWAPKIMKDSPGGGYLSKKIIAQISVASGKWNTRVLDSLLKTRLRIVGLQNLVESDNVTYGSKEGCITHQSIDPLLSKVNEAIQAARKIQEDAVYTAAKDLFIDTAGESFKPEFWWMQLLENQRFKNWPSTKGKTIGEIARSFMPSPEDSVPKSTPAATIQHAELVSRASSSQAVVETELGNGHGTRLDQEEAIDPQARYVNGDTKAREAYLSACADFVVRCKGLAAAENVRRYTEYLGVVLRPEDVYRLIACIRFIWEDELSEYSDEVLAVAVDPTQVPGRSRRVRSLTAIGKAARYQQAMRAYKLAFDEHKEVLLDYRFSRRRMIRRRKELYTARKHVNKDFIGHYL